MHIKRQLKKADRIIPCLLQVHIAMEETKFGFSTEEVISLLCGSALPNLKNIEIRAQEKGYLQSINVDEGRYVKAGQVLFQIMPNIYQAEYLKAEAAAKEAAEAAAAAPAVEEVATEEPAVEAVAEEAAPEATDAE